MKLQFCVKQRNCPLTVRAPQEPNVYYLLNKGVSKVRLPRGSPFKSLPFSIAFRLFLLCSIALQAQTTGSQQQSPENPKLLQRPSTPATANRPAEMVATSQQIELTVPAGTPIRIALTKRVRIAHAGT